MNRNSRIFVLLLAALFVVASGLDRALDHMTTSPAQSVFTVYDSQGTEVTTYDGQAALCRAFTKPALPQNPNLLHRS